MENIDFSKYKHIYCDSVQAVKWAYRNGLSKRSIIKCSSPAVLLNDSINTFNIESRWTVAEFKKFHSDIQNLTKNIFNESLKVNGINRELSLSITQFSYDFQKIIYKSACLDESDFHKSCLFIYVNGETGPKGNIMNSPWDQLLKSNPLFETLSYTLEKDTWKTLSDQKISYLERFKVAGYETLIYRLLTRIQKKIPNKKFSREVLMPNENELNIEIAYSLALQGVKINEIQLNLENDYISTNLVDFNFHQLCENIFPIMRERVEQWVTPSAVEVTMSLFKEGLKDKIKTFNCLAAGWEKSVKKSTIKKRVVLMNSPGNVKGYSLAYICRKYKLPMISSQHGVTVEISKAHDELHFGLENSVANIIFSYNEKIIEIEKNTYFNNSKFYNVGMPFRLIRMKRKKIIDSSKESIVYISTNLYNMGFSLSHRTDYENAKVELDIVTKVLSKLPHKVLYKTYPEDNRRYADIDPVLNKVNQINNISLFSKKVDMRYLISNHKIFITTCATSTLGWPVMSGKPVIFINQRNNNPLTKEAYISLSKGLFVFDFDNENFYLDLVSFLSQPICKIEELWKEKIDGRMRMIEEYFSSCDGGAGKKAAEITMKNYL